MKCRIVGHDEVKRVIAKDLLKGQLGLLEEGQVVLRTYDKIIMFGHSLQSWDVLSYSGYITPLPPGTKIELESEI